MNKEIVVQINDEDMKRVISFIENNPSLKTEEDVLLFALRTCPMKEANVIDEVFNVEGINGSPADEVSLIQRFSLTKEQRGSNIAGRTGSTGKK